MADSSVSTSSSDPPNLDNLPDLIYYHVFKNLDLDDLWDLRLVSKRLYGIVKSHKIQELSFKEYILTVGNWYSTIKSFKRGNQLKISKNHLLLNPTDNLLDLKYLKISDCNLSIRLDDLNKFNKLQILEIGSIKVLSNDLLKLPDLKALKIQFFRSYEDDYKCSSNRENYSLVIDTPNLHSVSFSNNKLNLIDDVVKFNYPQSVKHLQLELHDKNASIFTNLESLEFYPQHIEYPGYKYDIKTDDLMKFNNLRKLRFSDKYNMYIKLDKLKDLFKSKKNDLDMILNGVKLRDINKIDEYWKTRPDLEFQLNNYGQLEDDLHFVTHIDYSKLLSLSPDNQPANLLIKYTNIQELYICSEVKDDNRLIHFIRGCPNLISLSISRSSLNQQFYDQLPAISSLSYLLIYDKDDLNLNFEFIAKMPYLYELSIDLDALLNKRLNLNDAKGLVSIMLEVNYEKFERIQILKKSRDRYCFINCEKLDLHRLWIDHDKLIKWCKWIKRNEEKKDQVIRRES